MNKFSKAKTKGACPCPVFLKAHTIDQDLGQVPIYPHDSSHSSVYNQRSKVSTNKYNLRPRNNHVPIIKSVCSGKRLSNSKNPVSNTLSKNLLQNRNCRVNLEDISSRLPSNSFIHFTKFPLLNFECSVNLMPCDVDAHTVLGITQNDKIGLNSICDKRTCNNGSRNNVSHTFNVNNEGSRSGSGGSSDGGVSSGSGGSNSGGGGNSGSGSSSSGSGRDNDNNNNNRGVDDNNDDGDDNNGDLNLGLGVVGRPDHSNHVVIEKCGHPSCDLCDIFHTSTTFQSTITCRTYPVENFQSPSVDGHISKITCRSCNVIYLITCQSCFLQYVGETITQINRRTSKHSSVIRNMKCDTILVQHFNSGSCKDAKFTMQVIELWDGDGRLANGKMCPDEAAKRRKRETEWMLKLRTIYPYGLNHKVTEKSNIKKLEDVDKIAKGILFPPLPRLVKRPTLAPRNMRVSNTNFDPDAFVDDMKSKFLSNKNIVFYNTRVSLFSLKKSHLKALADKLIDILPTCDDDLHQLYAMALDVINSRIYTPPKSKEKRKPAKYQIKLPFSSKAMDFINLSKILHNNKIMDLGQNLISEEDIPMVVYKLQQPIRSSILNYNKFVSTLNLDNFDRNPESIPCHCSDFDDKFCDPHHKHIVTGDLNIIINVSLRNLIAKGPNFREPQKIDFDDARNSVLDRLDSFIDTISKVKKTPQASFLPWKEAVVENIDKNIEIAKRNFKPSDPESVLANSEAKKALAMLRKKFVLVPIDKASNNIALICKHYYAYNIHKEVDFANIASALNSTYHLSNVSKESIIQQHVDFQKKLGLEVKEDFRRLATHYWTPKMHKRIIGERFITASVMSSLKPLAKDVTKIFKCIFNFVRSYYAMAQYHSGLNYFWVIDNTTDFCKVLDRISAKHRARCISTFDFSTLYTKIPHDKLIDCLHFFIDLVFNSKDRKYLSVTSSGAHWVASKKSSGTLYDIDGVKNSLKFLIDNSYFYVGDHVFRQKIGIPMGLDPASHLANLFLAYYEIHWIKKLKKEDYARARKYNNNCRFIDDLAALNDDGEFERSRSQIYPEELQSAKENEGTMDATFLDLEVHVEDRKFDYHLYDKRDSFNFYIVRFPYECSNIPSKIFLSTIGAETLRICKASSTFSHFVRCCSPFYKRMVKQGAIIPAIKAIFRKFFGRHESVFSKFGLTCNQIVEKLHFG